MTEEQKQHYIKTKGVNCPYCGSPNLDTDPVDSQDSGIYQNVYCQDCRQTWTDTYTLTDVTPAE